MGSMVLKNSRGLVAILISVLVVATTTVATAGRANADDATATVEFLNPTAGSSLKISAKSSKDSTFSLSAWVSSASAVKLVEFEMTDPVNPLSRPISIGSAEAVTPDTYELQWAIPATVTDGNYNLQAIAYGQSGTGFIELDRDIEAVTILKTAETVDITNPVRGGKLGVFVPQGRPANGVVDTALSTSAGWTRLFYTTERPGNEPVWKLCGAQPQKKLADGVGCVFAAADRPEAVTAIAAIANSTPYMDAQGKDTGREQPDPRADQTADAARVSTYIQQPTTVTIDPLTAKVAADANGVFPCSPPMKATLVDQFGDGILGANIDIHASGPANGVYFEVVALVSKNQAPNKNHGGTEPAENCTPSPTTSNEPQGVHRNPGGLSVKHVESLPTGGTDDGGSFQFRLFSEAVGTTQITAWADIEEDDQFCLGEPSGSATLGWGAEADAAVAEKPADCGSTKTTRSIALQASKTKATRGEKIEFAGAISSADERCVTSQKVRLQARKLDSNSRFVPIARAITTKLGVFHFDVTIRRSKEFRAVTPATSRCVASKSVATKVRLTR